MSRPERDASMKRGMLPAAAIIVCSAILADLIAASLMIAGVTWTDNRERALSARTSTPRK